MLISDWSSDVCSSDLPLLQARAGTRNRATHCRRSQSAQPLDDRHIRHTAAFAHRLHAIATVRAFQLMQQRRHQLHTGGAERMRQRDRAAVDVGLLARIADVLRSEEHTSELQSLMRISYAVF